MLRPCRAVAAAGSARKLELASQLGADVVADCTSADWQAARAHAAIEARATVGKTILVPGR